MIKDIIMAFTIFAGSIFGYGFFMFWLNWFDKNYEIRRRNDKMIENIINDILNNMTEEEKELIRALIRSAVMDLGGVADDNNGTGGTEEN